MLSQNFNKERFKLAIDRAIDDKYLSLYSLNPTFKTKKPKKHPSQFKIMMDDIYLFSVKQSRERGINLK